MPRVAVKKAKATARTNRPPSPAVGKIQAGKVNGERDALAAEAKLLRLENEALKARLGGLKAKVQARLREIERGVEQRLKASKVPTVQRRGILDYMKVGFGATLGSLAAIAVVDVVSSAFDDSDDVFGGAAQLSPSSYCRDAKPKRAATAVATKKPRIQKRVSFTV
jgi:hypothetical protein